MAFRVHSGHWSARGRAPAEAHPRALQVQAPNHLGPGEPETVAATLKQGSRTLPVSGMWEGSPGSPAGNASGLRPRLDPGTGALTAIRPGQVKISAEANDVTSGAEVRVSPREAA